VLTLRKTQKALVPIQNIDLTKEFVGMAVKMTPGGVAHHAGIVISYSGSLYLCHYTGSIVVMEPFEPLSWYIVKSTLLVSAEEVLPFFSHCRLAVMGSKPEYGYFYSGSYYLNGSYFTMNGSPELMTCVGFCLNVFNGFFEAIGFVQYSDWDASTLPAGYLDEFKRIIPTRFPNLTFEELSKDLRRITPTEYLCTGFLETLSIRKEDTDSILSLVTGVISQYPNPAL